MYKRLGHPQHVVLITLCAVFILLAGCTSSGGSLSESQRSLPPSTDSLPPIPLDVPGHSVATTQNPHIDGSAAILKSAGANVQASTLQVWTTVNQSHPSFEWGIWRYTPDIAGGETVQSAALDVNVIAGTNSWIGIADYGKGQWVFSGPFGTSGGNFTFQNISQGNYISPGGNIYFLVAAYNGASCTVNGINMTVDIPAPTTYTISGTLTDTSNSQGIAGQTVTLNPGGATALTGIDGSYSFTNVSSGVYTLIAPTVAGYDVTPPTIPGVSVGPDSAGNNFSATPQVVGVTYETGAHQMQDMIGKVSPGDNGYCVRCHGPGGQEQFVPLTTYAEVQAAGFTNVYNQVKFGSMPQVGSPERTQWNQDAAGNIQKFTDWKDNSYAQ